MIKPRRVYAWREVLEDVRAFFDQAERDGLPLVIERHGRPAFIINPISEFAMGWLSGVGLVDEFATFAADELSRECQAEERYAETLTPPEHDWRQGGTPKTPDEVLDAIKERKHTTSPVGDPDYRPPRAH